jgi:hypothetical protein
MVVRSKEKETKEEKTQEYLLKKLFGDLYDQLNLSQFVKEDKTVKKDELKAYLEFLGFSEETIKCVSDYLDGKGGPKTTELSVKYEYDYNPNIQRKSKEFNELVGSIEKELEKTVGDERARKEGAFRVALSLIEKKDIPKVMECNISLNFKINDELVRIQRIVDVPITDPVRKELGDIQKFKPQELTNDQQIIINNVPQIATVAAKDWKTLLDSNASEQEKEEALKNYWEFLVRIGVSENKANEMVARVSGDASNELHKQGRNDEAEKLYTLAKDLLVNKYGMSLDDFNRAFFSGVADINLENAPNEAIKLIADAYETLKPDYFYEFIETIIRPLFGGTEEMQAGEFEVGKLEKAKEFLMKVSEEDRKALLNIISERIEELNEKISEGVKEEEKEIIETAIKQLKKLEGIIKEIE